MARILVVYYSRTGTTKRAAIDVASALDADLEGLSERTDRLGSLGWIRSAVEGTFHWPAKIERIAHDLASYDLVVLGSPTWNASLSSPVRAFVRQHRDALKAVAFFCTCGGSGGDHVFEQMSLESGKDPAAVLVLREGEITRGAVGPAIHEFADRIRQATSAGQRANPVAESAASSP